MYEKDFTILIVDDEKSNLDVLYHILHENHNIIVAKNGDDAIRIATEALPDLMLLDIILPGMDGFEVLTELKKNEDTAKIPIIIITGLNDMENEEKGFYLGAVDYITKPFHSSIVKARVETHLKIIRQMRTIERFCQIDSLTEIPNRRSFDNHLAIEYGRLTRDKQPLGILMIDVDFFKAYNDTYGHQMGDVVLKSLAKVFVQTLKRTTDLVFRWGGEEFTVLLPNTDLKGAVNVAEKIRKNTEDLVIGDGKTPGVTVSIGVYSDIPSIDNSMHDFVENADAAMYKAKQTGRNKVCY